MHHPSVWEELREAVSSLATIIGWPLLRGLLTLLVVISLLTVGMSALLVSFGLLGTSVLLPWLLVLLAGWSYVRGVRRAREALREAVLGAPRPEGQGEAGGPWGRARSLWSLRSALWAAQENDAISAEIALRDVERADLGAWESRIYEAVRVLICLGRGEVNRAAQLAPLALPTTNRDLDRRLGCLMVRASWADEARLAAIERGLYAAGGALHDLVLLCRARRDDLATGDISRSLSPRVCARVSLAASEVGDPRLASALLALATSQGAYR